MAEDDRWEQPPLQVTDPAMLRAFAHPVRQRILRELSVRTHARAADLAGWLGEPANALSFHLRTLARAGLVTELPEMARDKRDRVWALASPSGFSFDDPGTDAFISSFVAARIDWLRRLTAGEFDDNPKALAAAHFGAALLTKVEAEQFADEVNEVMLKWRKRGAENADREEAGGAERVNLEVVFALGPATGARG